MTEEDDDDNEDDEFEHPDDCRCDLCRESRAERKQWVRDSYD